MINLHYIVTINFNLFCDITIIDIIYDIGTFIFYILVYLNIVYYIIRYESTDFYALKSITICHKICIKNHENIV